MAGAIQKKKIFSFVTLLIVLLLSVLATNSAFGASQLRPDWLWDEDIAHTKLSDEPANFDPWSYGVDCIDTYVTSGLSWCVQQTPIGKVANSTLLDGPKGTHQLNTFYGFIAPSIPEKPGTILTYLSPSSLNGGQMVQYSTYKPANLKYVERFGLPPIKEYQYTPESPTSLKYANGQVASLVARSIAFSNNGAFMVASLNGGGVIVYNTSNWNGKVISVDTKLTGFDLDKKGANLAVSDDGQFVATNANLGSGAAPQPSLRVYDTRTCLDQTTYINNRSKSNGCEFRDVWTGEFRSLKHPAVKDALGVEYPRQIRFSTNHTVTFKLIHSRISPTVFSVSKHSASADMKTEPPFISLLGMGDSYISGEGAFNYRTPTDSKANKCHNSYFSYPYQKGLQHYPLTTSVACSGAVIEDVRNEEDDYRGQDRVSPQVAWESRSDEERSKINNQYIPGYQGQVVFGQAIKPKATLLSIGGNDIHFGDILQACVANLGDSTCYATYYERRKIMQLITTQYAELVKTYTELKNQTKGNIYVVGYPEIASPGKNCGANVHLDAEEVQLSVDIVNFLNKVIKNATSDAGVFYVDNQKALYGYRLCEAPKNKPGMNGLTSGRDGRVLGLKILGNESYHPTAYGYKLLGDSIVAKTNNFTATMPAKTSLGAPPITDNDPLLKGRKPANYNYGDYVWVGGNSQPITKAQNGKTYSVNVPADRLKTDSTFVAELHSEPIELASGKYQPNMKVVVTLPNNVPAGIHTIHIFGTNTEDVPIEIVEQIYVIASEADYNDDGVPNSESSCVFVPDSGIDEDADGIDDACDTVGTEDFTPEVPVAEDPQKDFSALLNGAVEPTVTDSLLTEYIEPKQDVLAPETPLQQAELTKTATVAKTSSTSVPVTYSQVAGAEVLGVASLSTETAIMTGEATKTTAEVIAKTTTNADRLPVDATKQTRGDVAWWVLAVVCTLIAVGMVIFAQTRRNKA